MIVHFAGTIAILGSTMNGNGEHIYKQGMLAKGNYSAEKIFSYSVSSKRIVSDP